MDSHKLNMYAGAIIGSLLLFLLLNFVTDLLYFGGGHHAEHEQLAYAVAVEGAGEQAAAEPAEVDMAALLASADAAKGEKVFGKCKSCHKLEKGANSTGPSLWGVVGRPIASEAGYSYDDALKSIGGDWTLENLFHFLAAPKEFAPGTKMSFGGLSKPQDRVDVIEYLNQQSDAPVTLTAPSSAGAKPAGAASDTTATASAAAAPATAEAAGTTEAGAAPAAAEAAGAAEAAAAPATTEAAGTAEAAAAPATTEAASTAEAGSDTAALLAAGDPEAGEKVYRKCKACHSTDPGKNMVGPSLHGVVGRPVASEAGFNYDDALKNIGGDWTPERLFHFLESPKDFAPGTKMSFAGLRKPEDRADVIAYLTKLGGS